MLFVALSGCREEEDFITEQKAQSSKAITFEEFEEKIKGKKSADPILNKYILKESLQFKNAIDENNYVKGIDQSYVLYCNHNGEITYTLGTFTDDLGNLTNMLVKEIDGSLKSIYVQYSKDRTTLNVINPINGKIYASINDADFIGKEEDFSLIVNDIEFKKLISQQGGKGVYFMNIFAESLFLDVGDDDELEDGEDLGGGVNMNLPEILQTECMSQFSSTNFFNLGESSGISFVTEILDNQSYLESKLLDEINNLPSYSKQVAILQILSNHPNIKEIFEQYISDNLNSNYQPFLLFSLNYIVDIGYEDHQTYELLMCSISQNSEAFLEEMEEAYLDHYFDEVAEPEFQELYENGDIYYPTTSEDKGALAEIIADIALLRLPELASSHSKDDLKNLILPILMSDVANPKRQVKKQLLSLISNPIGRREEIKDIVKDGYKVLNLYEKAKGLLDVENSTAMEMRNIIRSIGESANNDPNSLIRKVYGSREEALSLFNILAKDQDVSIPSQNNPLIKLINLPGGHKIRFRDSSSTPRVKATIDLIGPKFEPSGNGSSEIKFY